MVSVQTCAVEEVRRLLKQKQLINRLHIININQDGESSLPESSDLQISCATAHCELIHLLHADFISAVQRISSNEPFVGVFETDRATALIDASGMHLMVTEELYQKLGVQTTKSKRNFQQLKAILAASLIADNRPLKEIYLPFADAALIERCTQNLLQSQHINLAPGSISISCCSSDSIKELVASLVIDSSLYTSSCSSSDKVFSFFDPVPLRDLTIDQCQNVIDDILLWIGAVLRQPNVLVNTQQKVDPFISTASLQFNDQICSVAYRSIDCMASIANGQLCQIISDHLHAVDSAMVIVALNHVGVDFVVIHKPLIPEVFLIQF